MARLAEPVVVAPTPVNGGEVGAAQGEVPDKVGLFPGQGEQAFELLVGKNACSPPPKWAVQVLSARIPQMRTLPSEVRARFRYIVQRTSQHQRV